MVTWFHRGAGREQARDELSRVLTRLSQTGGLPTLPQTAHAALAAARELETDLDRLAAIVRTDVGLAACVLRLANSAVYARRQRATTLNAALTTIGLRKTCDVIVAAGARSLYGVAGTEGERLWSHALAVAIAAEELARLAPGIDPQTAFLPGLLHDIGRIVFFLADRTGVVAMERRGRWRDRCRLEVARYGFDHAAAGGALAEEWNLPPELCAALRWHHEPEQAESARTLALLVGTADLLAHSIEAGDGAAPPERLEIGLTADAWPTCVERVRESLSAQQSIFA
jgi:putative nucleotidyltransferase with HDIG domain